MSHFRGRPAVSIAMTAIGFFCIVAAPAMGQGPYCVSNPNSTGQPSLIDFAPQFLDLGGGGDFAVSATHLPAEPGIFIAGPNQAQIPYFDSFLCVDFSGLQRFGEVNIPDPDNHAITQQDNIDSAAPGGLSVMAGQIFNFQRWNRDPDAGMSGATFSDAYAVLVGFFPCQNTVLRGLHVWNINVCAANAAQAMTAANAKLCPCIGDCMTGTECTFTGAAGIQTAAPIDTGVGSTCPIGQTIWTVVISTPNGVGLCQCNCQ